MEKLVDLIMTKLFLLAEYVCCKVAIKQEQSKVCLSYAEPEQARLKIKCSLHEGELTAPKSQPIIPTIRFSNEDCGKRVKYDARIGISERKQTRPNRQDRMVEGDLFKS